MIGWASLLMGFMGIMRSVIVCIDFITSHLSLIMRIVYIFIAITVSAVIRYIIKHIMKCRKKRNERNVDLHCYENMPNEIELSQTEA